MTTITRERVAEIIHAAGLEPCDYEEVFGSIKTGEIVAMARIALASLEAEAVGEVVLGEYDDCGCHPDAKVVCIAADGQADWGNFKDGTPLYTAPPAPASVPECFKNAVSSLESLYRNGQKQNWNERYTTDMAYASGILRACRDAMLQGAEPVTTAYKLPANTPCKEAPEHIWLQTAGVWPENGEFSELTWCSNNQHPDDTLYVRADVAPGNSSVIPDGWVACSERMPEENAEQEVLACFKGGDISTLYYFEGRWDDAYGIVPIRQDVTHWMPLPAAPQQEVK